MSENNTLEARFASMLAASLSNSSKRKRTKIKNNVMQSTYIIDNCNHYFN